MVTTEEAHMTELIHKDMKAKTGEAHTAELIHKDMTVGEAVEKYPQVAEIFTRYGLHCVGCGAAYYETIEEGTLGHGMPQETMKAMLEEANKFVQESQVEANPDGLTLTPSAISRVKTMMQKQGMQGKYFRIGVTSGGCSGKSYSSKFDATCNTEDQVQEMDGVKVIITKSALQDLQGSTIDFVETIDSSSFKIRNPNAKRTCGCGSSFN